MWLPIASSSWNRDATHSHNRSASASIVVARQYDAGSTCTNRTSAAAVCYRRIVDQPMDKQRITVGLLWHSVKSGNLGVGALTAAHVELLDEVAAEIGVAIDVVTIGWSDDGPAYVTAPNLTSVEVRMSDFIPICGALWKAARNCDVVFDIGAGDSFTTIYGHKRFATQIASKLLTRAARRPLVLAPQTIGPFDGKPARALARIALRSSSRVFTRDQLSTTFVKQLDPRIDIAEVTDLAIALRAPADERRGDELSVGVNVSGLLMNSGSRGEATRFGLDLDYPSFVRRTIIAIMDRPKTRVHLVAHVIADGHDDDYRWCRSLAEEFPEAVLAPRFGSPVEAKSYISGLHGLIGARMHACIAAFSSGVPVLPVAYSRKFAGLFGTLGHEMLVDARTDDAADADALVALFLDSLSDSSPAPANPMEEAHRRLDLYRSGVRDILAEYSTT